MNLLKREEEIRERATRELLKMDIESREDLMRAKRKIAKKYQISIIRNSDILKMVGTGQALFLQRILRKRTVRTLSGIAPVAVLVKPFKCPGKCVYCPTEKDVPKSYLSNEPAVMRAIRNEYDPYQQIQMRLKALEANGHEPTKIELIVIGGTWSVLPTSYKYWFIKECFRGANEFESQKSKVKSQNYNLKFKIEKLKKILDNEQKKNERARYKIIGITLETRPDYINEKELWEMRELGCTRVELGVQATQDKILKLNQRGHGVKEITKATKLLKDYGFKVTYHIMPGLPGSSPAKDLKMFKQLFTDEGFQPDQIKFYPTVVTRGSLLYKWWREGKYKPYSDAVLQKLIIECKKAVPSYVRIVRLIRDIPAESIIAGNRTTNLRQILRDKGVKCRCIRCREVKDKNIRVASYELRVIKYRASGGDEYFISCESKNKKTLYGFCRLRLSSHNMPARFGSRSEPGGEHVTHNNKKSDFGHPKLDFLEESALIRELHVYGELVPIGGKKKVQHAGLGKRLMAKAEKIAKKNGFKKIAVIAGVGVRDYYRKLGYRQKNTYMVKNI